MDKNNKKGARPAEKKFREPRPEIRDSINFNSQNNKQEQAAQNLSVEEREVKANGLAAHKSNINIDR